MCLFVLRFTCLTWPSSILPQGADLTCLRHLGVQYRKRHTMTDHRDSGTHSKSGNSMTFFW